MIKRYHIENESVEELSDMLQGQNEYDELEEYETALEALLVQTEIDRLKDGEVES